MHTSTNGVQKGEDKVNLARDTLRNDTDSKKELAKERRLREPNEKCLLPTHLLHRLRAGPGGASCITFSPSGNLLAFAACDEPLPGKMWPPPSNQILVQKFTYARLYLRVLV